jgi:hypothetical protein
MGNVNQCGMTVNSPHCQFSPYKFDTQISVFCFTHVEVPIRWS